MTQNLRLVGPISAEDLNSKNTDVSDESEFALTASDSGTWCTSQDSSCYDQSMILYSGNVSYGTYYNWYAATASTGKYSTDSGNASSSICPKNWRLPTGGTNGDFQALLNIYNSHDKLINNSGPAFVLSGARIGGSNKFQGSVGYYWSGTAQSLIHAYYLRLESPNLYPTNYNIKYYGIAVRCLAK